MNRIYFDNCCLNRLFDDQSQDRVRLEAEAVALVLLSIQGRSAMWIGGDVLDWEVLRTQDSDRRSKLVLLLDAVHERILLSPSITRRAGQLTEFGFKGQDALHLASAEAGHADVLLTTDDDLEKKAKKARRALRVRVLNPSEWIREVRK
jgi:predicted nucleic acid-binding protein